MSEGRKNKTSERWVEFLVGAILVAGIAFHWCPPSYGMDALTRTELDELSGKAGISIAFPDAVTVQASFRSLSIGDTDGWGGKGAAWAGNPDDYPGWLVLIGSGSNTGYLSSTIPANSYLTIDVGTTGGIPCYIAGNAEPYKGIVIPANTPFFTFSLTDADIGLLTPQTVYIKMTNDATALPGNMETVGFMHVDNLMIDKQANMKSTCYIWARP